MYDCELAQDSSEKKLDNYIIGNRVRDMTSYQRPAITVDAIIEQAGKILLIKRRHEPFKQQLALPGGFVDYGERVEDAILREVEEEVGVKASVEAILGVYSDPQRDPRGHTISTVFICNFDGDPEAGDDAASYHWIALDDLQDREFAFDHEMIIKDYLQWKKISQSFWSSKS